MVCHVYHLAHALNFVENHCEEAVWFGVLLM